MRIILLLGAIGTILAATAHADDSVSTAKARAAAATGRATDWTGPTSGPKAVPKKTIVFVAGDLRNGGVEGASEGVKEAAEAIGWSLRTIDGQGTVSGRTSAIDQGVALHPDGMIVAGMDAAEQQVGIQAAHDAGITVVGWHALTRPGPAPALGLAANVNTVAADIADTAAFAAIADSNGHAGVVIFTDSQFEMAVFKAREMERVIKQCPGCTVLAFEDAPMDESSSRMPQLTTSLLQRLGDKWTYSLAVNDLYFDFMPPSLSAAGISGDGAPHAISAGDGSASAFQRIRSKQYQMATVPEPLNMQGWQLIDELNRAFAKQPWSGFVSGVHLVTADNIAFDGGPNNVFDPDNGYRDHYKAIWDAK